MRTTPGSLKNISKVALNLFLSWVAARSTTCEKGFYPGTRSDEMECSTISVCAYGGEGVCVFAGGGGAPSVEV